MNVKIHHFSIRLCVSRWTMVQRNAVLFEKLQNECKNPPFLHKALCIQSDHGTMKMKMRCCVSTFMACNYRGLWQCRFLHLAWWGCKHWLVHATLIVVAEGDVIGVSWYVVAIGVCSKEVQLLRNIILYWSVKTDKLQTSKIIKIN